MGTAFRFQACPRQRDCEGFHKGSLYKGPEPTPIPAGPKTTATPRRSVTHDSGHLAGTKVDAGEETVTLLGSREAKPRSTSSTRAAPLPRYQPSNLALPSDAGPLAQARVRYIHQRKRSTCAGFAVGGCCRAWTRLGRLRPLRQRRHVAEIDSRPPSSRWRPFASVFRSFRSRATEFSL